MNLLLRSAALAASAAVLCGCGMAGMVAGDQPLPPLPPERYVPPAAPANTGTIYADGHDLQLFSDLKAVRVGDLLTVVLTESTSAQKSANTKTDKTTKVDLPGPTLAGRPVTANGTPILEMGIDATREFEGNGSSSQSNKLTGNITVTVVQRLANGNLVIEGEKWLKLNQGDELVRIAGIVRPTDVAQDNTVTSDRIADARISYGGRGVLASSNRAGWLARFFSSPVMPY
jgi:flagellar L-ring protein precursor FlgH